MPNVSHVTAGKPKTGGHVWRAPLGTTLPTNAIDELSSAFVDMGYISEDGVTNSNSPESTTINAWGGTPVLRIQESKDDTFSLTFISSMNIEVQKMVYGDKNVHGTDIATGISVQSNAKELEEYVYVIDMIARDYAAHRVVIPSAKPTEIGDITYTDSDVVGYEVTLGCTADSQGNTHYDYWQTIPEEEPEPEPTPTYTYEEVTPEGTENPSEEGWYEYVDETYVLSEDTEVDAEKTYYRRIEG